MKPLMMDNYKAARAAGLFRVFGDADRVRIVSAILEQEMNTSTLAEMVGMTQPAVSPRGCWMTSISIRILPFKSVAFWKRSER